MTSGKPRWRIAATWLVLAGLMALAFGLRCWNWNQVFVGQEVHFLDPDCYSRMTRVERVLTTPWHSIRFHDFENAPQGTVPHATAPMDFAIAALTKIFAGTLSAFRFESLAVATHPLPHVESLPVRAPPDPLPPHFSSLDLAGAFISPLLGLVLMGFLCWWSRQQPWRWALLLVVTVSPILVHGFLLGRPDHQSLILLLVGMALAAEISLWTSPKPRPWNLISAVCWALALWTSLFEPLILLLAVLACRWFVLGRATFRIRDRTAVIGFVLILAVGLLFDGWRPLPSAPEITEFFPRWSQTIGELAHLRFVQLFPWTGWLLPVVPVLLLLRFRKEKSRPALAMAFLVLLTIGLSLWYARWGYFLALVFAFSLPQALAAIPLRPVVAAIFILSLWPVAAEWDRQFFPDIERERALAESREDASLLHQVAVSLKASDLPLHAPVLAPWWLSPALSYWSGRPCVAGSSHQSLPGIVASARFYLTSDPLAAREILRSRGVRFVVAYEPSRIDGNSAQILGVTPPRKPMGNLLYHDPAGAPDWLRLIFKNKFFKVYEVQE